MWNMFKINNKDTRKASFWCLYCQLWTYFTPCSTVSIVNFEQVNADWVFAHKFIFHEIVGKSQEVKTKISWSNSS